MAILLQSITNAAVIRGDHLQQSGTMSSDQIFREAMQILRNAWQTQLEDERPIPTKYWTDKISELKPIRIYVFLSDIVIVMKEAGGIEEGIFVGNPASSYLYRPGDGYGFELFAPKPNSLINYRRLRKSLALMTNLEEVKPRWEAPGIGGRDLSAKFTVAAEMVSAITIGSFRVTLEQTYLDEASAHLGSAIGHAGEGGEGESWICLQGENQIVPWALWLRSGDMDNGTNGKVVGGFTLLIRSANENLDSRCGRTKDRISLPIPLRLGMSREEVLSTLGLPTLQSERLLLYSHHGRPMQCPKFQDDTGPCDLINQLYIHFDDNRVDGIEVWHLTTK